MAEKEQLGPRVPGKLAEAYKWLVRKENGGVYRGRLAQEMEKAMRYHMGWFATLHPDVVEELGEDEPELAREFEEALDTYEEMSARVGRRDPSSGEEVEELTEEVRRLADVVFHINRDVQEIRENMDGDFSSRDVVEAASR
ncbi:hypothetical protein [Natronococcus roseus]|uniref:hypothetical protein n=1 Tax=Natronococcus roseus TaxID=1052014 RepID=UPI00374D0E81